MLVSPGMCSAVKPIFILQSSVAKIAIKPWLLVDAALSRFAHAIADVLSVWQSIIG
jgi:hypothetical protein